MLSFIFVDYYSWEDTFRCVKEIINKSIGDRISIVIVDNSINSGNTQSILAALGSYQEEHIDGNLVYRIEFLDTEICVAVANENGGYSKGNNLGYKIAREIFLPEYICFANSDIRIKTEQLDVYAIEQYFEKNERIGIIGPQIIDEQSNCISPYRKISYFLRWIILPLIYPFDYICKKHFFKDVLEHCEQGEVYRVQGSFMFCRADDFARVGGFDEKTFLFSEESILSEKMLRIGQKTYYLPEVIIVHKGNHIIGNSYSNIEKLRIRYASEEYYYKKYLNVNQALIFIGRIIFEIYLLKVFLINKVRNG